MLTPPLTNYILAGVTRGAILDMAALLGIPVSEEPISADLIYQADEVFVSGTNAELGPVIEVDGRQIGTGQPGPIFEKVLAAFDVATGQRQPVSAGSG